MKVYRTEHPNPAFFRENWMNLNGEWEFEIDRADVGLERGYEKREHLDSKINVPFCPESKLSGIEDRDFLRCVWYKKTFTLPESFSGKHTLIHFGAVDYIATVFINGEKVGSHKGGYTSFSFDITDKLTDGENSVVVCAVDYERGDKRERSGPQPSGKQSHRADSYGCFYTRTTGIWQTVWLEAVSAARVESYRVYPDITNGVATIQFKLTGEADGMELSAVTKYDGKETGTASATVYSRAATVAVKLSELHLWEIGEGRLYDLEVTLKNKDKTEDTLTGYFGIREVGLNSKGMTLNGKVFFGRYVLDQGFYPDGLYTAPDEESLKNDILTSLQLGFNGARLHEKVFEPLYLYWADKLGYLVWGEYANWGLDVTTPAALDTFIPEWIESVERDFSHPSIIGWCPFNETWNDFENGAHQCDSVIRNTYLVTKAIDPTRPVIDTSGNFHTETDIYDVHDYEQDVERFIENYAHADECNIENNTARKHPGRQTYTGGPLFISEYGGIKWSLDEQHTAAWGYGKSVESSEEFIERYKGLTHSLFDNEYVCAFCYTQLYDVEQECNGLMTYDRKFKFDPKIFYEINTRKAKIEE